MPYSLKPEEVREKYGPMFSKGLYTIVDEENGLAKIIEVCTARGPMEGYRQQETYGRCHHRHKT